MVETCPLCGKPAKFIRKGQGGEVWQCPVHGAFYVRYVR